MATAGREYLRVVYALVLILGLGGWCEGCWEKEKLGLLQLKPFVTDVEKEGKKSSDCCKWEMVECDATTGRVIGLSLENSLGWTGDGRYLNASLFTPFEELKSLSLGGNQIIGCLHNEGFEKLASKLKKLEILDLSYNWFNDSSILSCLVEFSSLKSLNLSYNEQNGSISHASTEMDNLINLKELDLRGNEIEGLDSLHGLINLEVLGLTLNILNSSLLSSLGPFSKGLKHLYITDDQLKGSIDIKDARSLNNVRGSGVIAANNSVLLPQQSLSLLPSLKTLHFVSDYDSSFDATVTIKELRNLTNLEELEVEYVILPINFFEDVGELTSLRVFSLRCYGSDGSLPIQDVGELIYLSPRCRPESDGSLPIQGLLHLKNLESLNIEEISLQNSFLEKIGSLTSLKTLSLPRCGLNGTLSTQDICQLTLLEILDIKENELSGVLPDCFSNLTFLESLTLSSNQFSGNLAASPLQSLTSIQYIDLSNNQFQIPSSLKPFFNHSKLKYFYGGNNHIYTETELHSLAPRFQLNAINLSCCGDARPLPEFLFHQHELQSVDLSHINLTGEFPSWLLGNNTKLKRLFLVNNSLSGNFRLPFHSPMKLLELDISKNFFDGHIPVEIGVCLPGLMSLNISKNSLNGSIPTSIGNMRLLQKLDLSDNRLSGVIPENLAMCCSLKILALSNNRLQGQIFSASFNLTNLKELYLYGNNFIGSIPNSLSNCSFLSRIDIGYNHLSGRIPTSIANLSQLEIFNMPNNHVEGPIPIEFCQHSKIGVLDLSMNKISGTLASCFGSIWNNNVHLFKNRLRGPIPKSICESSNLVTLDLGDNQFTGNIPNCIGNLSELHFLVLKRNNLEGEIPNQFCQLDKLALIDLSHNNLSGHIPNCLNVTTYEEIEINIGADCATYYCRIRVLSLAFVKTDHGSIELTTKNRSYSYKGRILRYFSGIDLSSNKLTGKIPHEMGNFHTIVMLNISHNSLTGSIPQSLSNLKNIESLDLSYNNLSGRIPIQFVELYSLAYFNVSYNNLSGSPPPRIAQFATDFDEKSYWGNPLICGEPLPKNCSPLPKNCSTLPKPSAENKDVGSMDMESFYVTFIVSYIMVLLSIAAILYINPHWRRAWFYLIERGIDSCFYFVVDSILPRQLRLCLCGDCI
ncbi:hypothetical protein DITRI_Ditri10aG0170000 [Diplodiscus trichospermus]